MKVHYGFDDVGSIRNAVVTTGAFDGVHIGHKTIINRINEIARAIDGESVIITFYPHPRRVLYPETEGKKLRFILSQREKIDLLSRAGVDHLILVTFTLEFARVSSLEFIKNYLVDKLQAQYIVVGFNHHFGHNREGGFAELKGLSKELGFRVEEIPEQDIQQEMVSSTTIRKALLEGRIQRANAYLDHQYIMIGSLGKGTHFFEQANYPTLMVQIDESAKLIPPEGIYAVTLEWNTLLYKAMVIIWTEHSSGLEVDASNRNVELHIFDFDMKFCSQDAKLYFHKRITGAVDVDNAIRLKHQLAEAAKSVDELIF